MMLSEDVLAWVQLTRAPGLDSSALEAAIDLLGSANAILRAPEALLQRTGIGAAARDFLLNARSPSAAEQRWLGDPRHHLLPFTDPRYPPAAACALGPPDRTVRRGQYRGLERSAARGRRQPQPHSRREAIRRSSSPTILRNVASESSAAWRRASTAAAHRGALAAQGITLAVLGSGLDVIYPRSQPGLERGDRAARRADQRISAANRTATRQFPAAQPHHRSAESRDVGGRGGAQERLVDHVALGQ